jgi:hypothetical protein
MFCDLEGSTALTEKLGDEKAFALIDEIFGILTQQVHKYEGTVQEFRGDGIMAFFGFSHIGVDHSQIVKRLPPVRIFPDQLLQDNPGRGEFLFLQVF